MSSFVSLQRLSRSFSDVARTDTQTRSAHGLLRLAEKLGTTALPICFREIAGADTARAEWAHTLLVTIAGAGHEDRVVETAREKLPTSSQVVRARLGCLLSELGARPDAPESAEPSRRQTVTRFAAHVADPIERAKCANQILECDDDEAIVATIRELAAFDVAAADSLISELLAHAEIDIVRRARIASAIAP